MSARVKFQRRHFAAVAEIIRKARMRPNDDAAEAIDDIEQDLADLFRADNPRFEAPRFYAGATRPIREGAVMDANQKADIEAFARWQREELALEAELVACKARHATRGRSICCSAVRGVTAVASSTGRALTPRLSLIGCGHDVARLDRPRLVAGARYAKDHPAVAEWFKWSLRFAIGSCVGALVTLWRYQF